MKTCSSGDTQPKYMDLKNSDSQKRIYCLGVQLQWDFWARFVPYIWYVVIARSRSGLDNPFRM